MTNPTHVPATLRRVLGRAQFALLSAVGRAADRFEVIYRADARWATRRMRRDIERHARRAGADPRALVLSERSVRSQNGEDGVIEEIFRRIGETNRHAIEIGAGDGTENCTRALVDHRWSAHWVEADPERARAARSATSDDVTVIAESAYRDSVVDLLLSAGAPHEPDLLVVDIDGDDLGVLSPCVAELRPRVVVTEYNAAFAPVAIWASGPHRTGGWDGTFRHGASLGALDHDLSRLGYSLVHCDSAGVNAFYVRTELAGDQFPNAGDLRAHHRVGAFSANPMGHPRSPNAVAPMTPLDVEDVARLVFTAAAAHPPTACPGGLVRVTVRMVNGSGRWLSSSQEAHAVNLSLRWLDAEGRLPPDAPRTALPRPIAPHAATTLHLVTTAPESPGTHMVRITAVAERTAWRELIDAPGGHADAEVVVEPSPPVGS